MAIKNFLLFLPLSVAVLTGCTVGQSEFNCSAGDENALCASTRTIYKATDGEIQENETITYVKDGEVQQITLSELNEIKGLGVSVNHDVAEDGSISETQKPMIKSKVAVPFSFSYDGQVLRKDVRVLRIWVAPWVDKSDDLHLSTLVYTDIEKRKWEVGTVDEQAPKIVKPHLKKPVTAQGSKQQVTTK
ncbi:type IV conjugative transfer system protein TraV [Vibrio breoganii]|uniref:Type IV conjugative transfer system protein TraV n=1 Tax=Vibrio breoganii TaxID=553239 RepID=A0AAP8SYE8_9VIBR|nr:type IV conjugative transfer system lipoprotein TraV [Vibrio breoganii]PMK78544.1 type IV conjugative transfer system protein TraV [Vibrio breoganii]PMP14014.1 type IV conjugative transfer system protein TraV [Vibrio breoganii]